MNDNEQQFDAEMQALIERQRAKDKTLDWTANLTLGSYLILPQPSQDVVQRMVADNPPPAELSDEEKLQQRLASYKDAVAFGLFSEWPDCKQAFGIERQYERFKLDAWNKAANEQPLQQPE